MKKNYPIILIGLTPQGLSILRLLARNGIKVFSFTDTKKTVGYFSKYGEKYVFESVDDLKEQINRIVQQYEGEIKCIISSGVLLTLIIDYFPEIYDLCDVQSGPYSLIKKLSNKKLMYDFSERKGLKSARCKLLSSYKKGDLEFPVILKRNIEVPLFFKVIKIESEDELFSFLGKLRLEDHRNILVQEFIEIQKYKPLTYQAYYFNGVKKGFFLGIQERRLSIGITSFLIELKGKAIVDIIDRLADTFFEETEYNGFAELEFMFDEKTNNLIFMEINTRACGTNSALIHKFTNLYDMFDGSQNPPFLESVSKSITWINIARDIRVRIKNKDFKNLSQFFTAKYDVLDFGDIKPFIYQFFLR